MVFPSPANDGKDLVKRVIGLPGERIEIRYKEVFINGIPSFHDDKEGKEKGQNTIYVIEAEGLRFCHLGLLKR